MIQNKKPLMPQHKRRVNLLAVPLSFITHRLNALMDALSQPNHTRAFSRRPKFSEKFCTVTLSNHSAIKLQSFYHSIASFVKVSL